MKTNLIGLSGKIQSGKDTVFDIINKKEGFIFENKKFADKIKDIVCILIGCTREQLEDHNFKSTPLGKEWDSLPSYRWAFPNHQYDTKHTTMTPRLMLQLIGTECGRDIIHPNIWVNALFSEYKRHHMEGIYPDWIVTDVRFINEIAAIRERGGIVIRIDRPCGLCDDMDFNGCSTCHSTTSHLSETCLDNYNEFDYRIINDGSLEDLQSSVYKIINKI